MDHVSLAVVPIFEIVRMHACDTDLAICRQPIQACNVVQGVDKKNAPFFFRALKIFAHINIQ